MAKDYVESILADPGRLMSTVVLSRKAAFLRRVRQRKSCLLAVLALVACHVSAADDPQITQLRDGSWLRNGINQLARLNAHETLSEKETDDALVVRSYVCAIVDLERYLVLRADLLASAVGEGGKKRRASAERLAGMAAALPILVPLMQTRFSADGAPCDGVVLTVGDYLDKYPEMLTKDAALIIDRALLDAYSSSNVP
jgi:hypothetical protein